MTEAPDNPLEQRRGGLRKSKTTRSVTIVNLQPLPRCSNDYQWNEIEPLIELLAHSNQSLSNFDNDKRAEYLLLYLTWNGKGSVENYVDVLVLQAMRLGRGHGKQQTAPEQALRTTPEQAPPQSPIVRTESTDTADTDASSSPPKADPEDDAIATKLYIVVDFVDPGSEAVEFAQKTRKHQQNEQLGLLLAKATAKQPELRSACQGLMVGISNHARALPGLEAVITALSTGASDRRRINSKSLIGVVAEQPLGSEDAPAFNVKEGVLQSFVCAEWNHQGNLPAFARRAHATWRQRHGLPVEQEPVQPRKIPRRIRPMPVIEPAVPKPAGAIYVRPPDHRGLIMDVIGGLWFVSYFVFHLWNEWRGILWIVDRGTMEEFVQHLREI